MVTRLTQFKNVGAIFDIMTSPNMDKDVKVEVYGDGQQTPRGNGRIQERKSAGRWYQENGRTGQRIDAPVQIITPNQLRRGRPKRPLFFA